MCDGPPVVLVSHHQPTLRQASSSIPYTLLLFNLSLVNAVLSSICLQFKHVVYYHA
jgi:hypothetical protein